RSALDIAGGARSSTSHAIGQDLSLPEGRTAAARPIPDARAGALRRPPGFTAPVGRLRPAAVGHARGGVCVPLRGGRRRPTRRPVRGAAGARLGLLLRLWSAAADPPARPAPGAGRPGGDAGRRCHVLRLPVLADPDPFVAAPRAGELARR